MSSSYETCGGPHAYYECQAAGGYTQDVYATSGTYNQGGNTYQTQGYYQNPGQNYNQNQVPNQSPSKEMMRQLLISNQLMQNEMADLKKILLQRPHGTHSSNTEPNPREQVNSIMRRSGLTTAEPSIPPLIPPTPKVEVEKEPEILMDEQLRFDISHMDALTQIPKFTKVLKDLLKDKEKLEELENTLINAECSAILLTKVPKKLEDPRKFLIPCILQDLKVYNSLAASGASINLMPLLIYDKLGVGPLKPNRITLELANHYVKFLMGIAEDVIIKVEKFNFLADFIIVDFEADPRVPIILGRPFLRTARALVDLYEEKLTLRFGNEEVVFYTDKSSRNNSSDFQSVHCINIIDFSRDKPISGSTTFPSDSSPISPLVETSDSLLEEFADELALLDPFLLGNEDDNFDPEADLREIEYLLNRDPSTVSSPTTDIDIIDPILERFTTNLLSFTHLHREMTMMIVLSLNLIMMNGKSFCMLPTIDLTLPEESSEIATLLSSPFGNEDKVFNHGIFIFGETQVFNNESKDKDFKMNISSEKLFEDCNFLPLSSDRELLFFLELTVIETLL
ncbi:reverse transcriptase domain-containing protein [Tanacetum coccineum]